MFRRGGQASGGITTGLGRQGYSEAGSVTPMDTIRSQMEMLDQLAPAPKTGLNDFLINFGLNMVGNAPSGNIFQTAAKEAQDPFAKFQQQRSQDELMKYKHAQGERQFQLEIYKALSDKDKHALQEKIDYLMDEFGLTAQEALNKALPDFRKPRHPDEQKLLDSEYERDQLDKEIERIQIGLSSETEYISKEQAAVIHNFYAQAKDQGWRYEADTPYIDFESIKSE